MPDARPLIPTPALVVTLTLSLLGVILGLFGMAGQRPGAFETLAATCALLIPITATMLIMRGIRKTRSDSQSQRWKQRVDTIVHTERIEAIGHTRGGLCESQDRTAGALSEPDPKS